jgi:hypothetical protein
MERWESLVHEVCPGRQHERRRGRALSPRAALPRQSSHNCGVRRELGAVAGSIVARRGVDPTTSLAYAACTASPAPARERSPTRASPPRRMVVENS